MTYGTTQGNRGSSIFDLRFSIPPRSLQTTQIALETTQMVLQTPQMALETPQMTLQTPDLVG